MSNRELDNQAKVDLVSQLTGGFSEVFSDAGLLFTDRPGFVAGSGSDSPLAQSVRELTRFTCRRWAREPSNANSDRQNAYLQQVCTPYLDSINEAPDDAALVRGVQGGQCPGVSYNCTIFVVNATTGAPVTITRNGEPGPISIAVNPGAINCTPGGVTNEQYSFISGGIVRFSFNGRNCGPFKSVPRVVCVPADGSPDQCGNGEPQLEPARPRRGLPALPPPPVVNVPGLGDVTVNVQLTPGGPVLEFPDLGIEVPVSISPGGGGGGGGGAPPGDVGEPGAPSDTGQGGDADGEAPSGSVLVGLRIDFAAPPIGGTEYAPGVYRGVCYVYMGTAEGLDHDPAGAMLRDGQFVYAEKDNLTRWAVSANRGYNLRVTPYYRQVETGEE